MAKANHFCFNWIRVNIYYMNNNSGEIIHVFCIYLHLCEGLIVRTSCIMEVHRKDQMVNIPVLSPTLMVKLLVMLEKVTGRISGMQ